jgi:hypothetical protein
MNFQKINLFIRLFYVSIFILFIPLIGGSSSFAQPIPIIDIPSSWNPVGSGARALGIGGAFIAIADDATAASWNPGGLIQIERPEVSIVGAYFNRTNDLNFGDAPEASGSQDELNANLNYLSAAYPFNLFKRNMIVSLNYQSFFDFTRKWKFPLKIDGTSILGSQVFDYQQDGGLSAIGLAYCVQMTPQFSFGVTLNYWGDALVNGRLKLSHFGS